jgi:hypothetical protein
MESIEQTINGSVGASSRVTSTISRNGDLVYKLYYEFAGTVVGNGTAATDLLANPGAAIFDNVEVEIGGQRIDRQTGQWMHVWTSLTEPNDARVLAAANGSGGTLAQELSGMGGCLQVAGDTSAAGTTGAIALSIPLQFWFCRNPGLALPLIALQYHEVKVVTSWSSMFPSGGTAALWADYIYLDTDERRRFAQVSHEYLIEQVQFQAGASSTVSTELNFNHPVKELIWTKGFTQAGKTGFGCMDNLAGKYQLKLNGHDRMAQRSTTYFTKQQVHMHHTGCGGLDTGSTNVVATGTTAVGAGADTIAVYSFALKPEEHQPSGTCNFSRIDNAQLYSDTAEQRDVFAVNYNVLRIMSGMGGLAYSN